MAQPTTALATFAAGCFWSVELRFQRLAGVLHTRVGYTNGACTRPTYEQVCSGLTGHAEAVQVEFNPAVVSYETLLEEFWNLHDPTTKDRQKNDIGTQYRSGIYTHSAEQQTLALQSMEKAQHQFPNPITTEIVPVTIFYEAEEYHQRYLEKGGQCAAKGCTDFIRCYG